MSGDAVGITLGHLISMPCHDESMETEFIPFSLFRLSARLNARVSSFSMEGYSRDARSYL